MANESSPSLAPRLPLDSFPPTSNEHLASRPELAFRAAASRSPLSPPPPPLPFTLSTSTREPLPNFAFPSTYSTGAFFSDLGGLPADDSSILRGSVSPNYSSLSHAPTTLDHLLSRVNDSASLAGSLSVNGAATQQPSSHLVQRLIQQNNKIRDAWEAERKYLEANRRRAEEVYQEERVIMEDLREVWHSEKSDLLQGMQLLRERIQRLEGENSALKAMTQSMSQVTGVLSPLASQRGDSVDGSADHSPTGYPTGPDAAAFVAEHMSHHQYANISSANAAAAASLPPGLDGASRRPHFASPPRQHLSPPTATLDPRTQPEASVMHDFLASSSEEAEVPVAVIDVQEIDPKLEGISLKVIAVQKHTFTPDASLPATHHDHPGETVGSLLLKRGPLKNQTMRALATEASRRLTMNAGHTPIHSLSAFPTMTTATGASSVVSRSGDSTPTKPASSPPRVTYGHYEDGIQYSDHLDETHEELSLPSEDRDSHTELDDLPFQPSENDPPLRGPLMVKNIPAQDELFWAAVNKKLEPISQGQDALPTVMQTPVAEIDAIQWPDIVAPHVGGGNGTRDAHTSKKDDDVDDDLDANGESSMKEHDVPLKLKTTTNFGAPFGMM